MERQNKPIDVKVAEVSQKVDIVTGVGGGLLYLVNPALGASIILWSGASWFGGKLYKDWRMKGKQQAA